EIVALRSKEAVGHVSTAWSLPALRRLAFYSRSKAACRRAWRIHPRRQAKKNRRQQSRRRCRSSRERGLGLAEQGEDGARALVGDRQRLNAELLLRLQSLQVGALGREVGVDELADTGRQRVGQGLDEVRLRL